MAKKAERPKRMSCALHTHANETSAGPGHGRFVFGEKANLDVTSLIPSSYWPASRMSGLNSEVAGRDEGSRRLQSERGTSWSIEGTAHRAVHARLISAGLCPV